MSKTTVFCLCTLLMALCAAPLTLNAITRTVTSNGNAGAGTLRQEVIDAANGDVIVFDASISLITLSSNIEIDVNITIDGPGADELTISGGNSAQIFHVSAGGTVEINGLTLEDGRGGEESFASGGFTFQGGGAIYMDGSGTLNIIDCEFVDNNSQSGNGTTSFDYGGAIFYAGTGTSTISRCLFTGNSITTSSGISGGAVHLFEDADVTVINCTFTANSSPNEGGGIVIDAFPGGSAPSLEVVNCTFFSNTASGASFGGDIHALGNGKTVILQNNIFNHGGAPSTLSVDINGTGTATSRGGNIFRDTPSGITTIVSDNVAGGNTSAGLTGTLAANGGGTRTIAISGVGSLATGFGTTGFTEPSLDQRVHVRDGDIDAGAFEFDGYFNFAALDPVDGATLVPVTSNLVMSFLHNVTISTGSVSIRRTSDDTLIESVGTGNMTGGGTKHVTINPTSDLPGSIGVYVEVPSSLFTGPLSSTFGAISGNSTWNFTTAGVPDQPPVVSTTQTARTAQEDVATTLSVTITDDFTATSALVLTATSGNQSVVADAGIVQQGATAATSVFQVTPVTNASGIASIFVSARDTNGNVSTATFTLTVNAVNDAPVIATNNTAVSTNEDIATNVTVSLVDVDTALNTIALTATSSNQSLLPDGNITQVGVTQATSQFSFLPAMNASGVAQVTITADDGGFQRSTTFTLTVNAVNDPPTIATNNIARTTNEDNATTVTVTLSDPESPIANLQLTATSGNVALVSNANIVQLSATLATTQFQFTPTTNSNGTVDITITADDGQLQSSTVFTLTVNAVNDAPVFSTGPNLSFPEDSGSVTSASWVPAGFGPGGSSDESGQTLTFNLTTANTSLFAVLPTINPGNGDISFQSAPNSTGTAVVDVTLSDNGGTANGGQPTSATQSFNIVISALNDAPEFTTGLAVTVLEDSGPYSMPFATGISDGDVESVQTLTFHLVNDNTSLFSVQPSIVATNGTLEFTPASNANGTALVTVSLSDNGANGGGHVNTSATQQFTITVTPVNDIPSFATTANVIVPENNGPFIQAGVIASISDGDPETTQSLTFHVTTNNVLLFSSQPSISSTGALLFTAQNNSTGTARVFVSLSDDGGPANGGVFTSATQSFLVLVNNFNDPPVFTTSGNVVVPEDNGPTTSPSIVVGVSDGDPTTTQVVSFHLINSNPALFAQQPTVNSTTGTTANLFFTPADDAVGTALVTISASDDGQTGVGHNNTSASQTFLITMTPVNDPPTIGNIADNSIPQNTTGSSVFAIADIDNQVTTLTLSATSSDQSLIQDSNLIFSPTAATTTLFYTPDCGEVGSAVVTVTVQDASSATVSTNFTVTVLPVPAADITGATCACPEVPLVYSIADQTGASYSWSIVNGIILGGQNSTSVSVDWAPGTTGQIRVDVTSQAGCTQAAILVVEAKNVAANMDLATVTANLTTVANFCVTFDVLGNDDGTGLQLIAVNNPSNGTITTWSSSGSVTYKPNVGFEGIDGFSYRIQDVNGCKVTGNTVEVVVSNSTDIVNLYYVERQKDRSGGVRGLRYARSVTVSPDGKHVYVAGRSDHSIAIFSRSSSDGALSYLGRAQHAKNGITSMKFPMDVEISPDGNHLYVSSYGNKSIVVLARNATTGLLSFVERKRHGQQDAGKTILGLNQPIALALSSDGKSLYCAGYGDHTVSVFRRDAGTGKLEYLERQRDGVGGVDGLNLTHDLTVSLDGKNVYAVGYGDNAVVVFERNLNSGLLSFVERLRDGIGGVDGLNQASSVHSSFDGKHVYVSGFADDALALFNRSSVDGSLSFVKRYKDGSNGGTALDAPFSLRVSADGKNVYVSAESDNALTVFARAASDGELTVLDHEKDGVDGADGLRQVQGIAVSADSRHIYCSSRGDNAVSVIWRNRAPVALDKGTLSVLPSASLVVSGLLTNADKDGQALTITGATGATLGALSITGGGTTITYDAGAVPGSDSFDYTIDDGHGGSSTATVTVNVSAIKLSFDNTSALENGGESGGNLARFMGISPNPARDEALIEFELYADADIRLRVVDVNGRTITILSEAPLADGRHQFIWDTRLKNGAPVSAGQYYLVLELSQAGDGGSSVSAPLQVRR